MGLILGTVQLGLPYGISNDEGQPDSKESAKILDAALAAPVCYFDSASVYGDSESIIARSKVPGSQIVTKIPSLGATGGFYGALQTSLQTLQRQSIYAVLFHDANDLLGTRSSSLMEEALEARERGQVKKFGVSVYSPEQARQILERHEVDLIQLPYNVFDQRASQSGLLRELKQAKVEVHVRSIFLQGLLLMVPEDLPASVQGLKNHLQRFREKAAQFGLSPLAAAIHFVRQNENIDHQLVGVNTLAELHEVTHAYADVRQRLVDWQEMAVNDEFLIDPSKWSAKS